MKPTITVLGAGYVGLTTATLFAHAGYTVYLIEPANQQRLKTIQSGKSFFFEEGIDPLIAKVIEDGSLIATDSYELAIPKSDVVFSCVGTPDNDDGSSNLSYVFSSAEETAKLAEKPFIFVQKSTVPVGTGEKVEAQFKKSGATAAYVSNPEFLREGTAISDTLFFDRVVVGSDTPEAAEAVLDIYRELEKHRDSIAALAGIANKAKPGQYIATTRNSAELIKVTANAFLALKISFANSIAKLADQSGADVTEVMDAVGADSRIGRSFLNAGRGYGGGCFPKDVSGLIRSAEQYGVPMEIMEATQSVNSGMAAYTIKKLEALISAKDATIAVLGLAFKAGTSDTRKSPGITIANTLASKAKRILAYDPEAIEEATHDLVEGVELTETLEEALSAADVVVIAVDWPEFNNPSLYSDKIVVDAMNMFDTPVGKRYTGIGRKG